MVRLIDADAIEHCLVIGGRRHGKTIISEIIRRAIQTAPTVDAVPVRHGHWDISIFDDADVCSRCGNTGKKKYRYCPYCGAKMNEERK